jgi:hypothetical protein
MKCGSGDCNTAISPEEETASNPVPGSPRLRVPEKFRSVENISTGAPSHEAL